MGTHTNKSYSSFFKKIKNAAKKSRTFVGEKQLTIPSKLVARKIGSVFLPKNPQKGLKHRKQAGEAEQEACVMCAKRKGSSSLPGS